MEAAGAEWETLGGVGGLEDGKNSISVSSFGSEILPVASRSKRFSVSSCFECCCGVGGSGLWTSNGVDGSGVDGEASGDRVGILELSNLCLSNLINFPCRELGGGGFFRSVIGDCAFKRAFAIGPWRSSSSSGSDISCEVRGVSWAETCTGSKTDWRDAEEVSAKLALSA